MKRLLLATALIPFGGAAFAECAPDYSGVTLTISTQNGPFIASALQAAADSWAEKTCGEVEMVEFPFSELVAHGAPQLQILVFHTHPRH